MSPEQIRQYNETGYTIVRDFFAASETAALKREVQRFLAQDMARDVAIPDGKRNLQLIPLWPVSRLFRAVPFHPKVVQAVSALLGDPVVKILDQMFYKPPGDGMGTNWHTDNAYFKIAEPLRGCAMWIAIDDANAKNGGLKVVPSVFDQEFLHERDPDSDHHIRTYLSDTDAVQCEVPAGSVVFFSFGTPHATGPNPTRDGRAGVGIHFVNFDYANADMHATLRWQQVFLTGPDASGGEREYGERISFAEEVATAAADLRDPRQPIAIPK